MKTEANHLVHSKTIESQRIAEDRIEFHSEGGLTKREYFAAMALQGLLASQQPGYTFSTADEACNAAIEHADALINQLNQSK